MRGTRLSLWLLTAGMFTAPIVNAAIVGVESGPNSDYSCAITDSNDGWCWGYNYYGQLGDNTTKNSNKPVAVSFSSSAASFFGKGIKIQTLATGLNHTCVATSDGGDVWCWGFNNYGQLGNNSTTKSQTPVPVLTLSTGGPNTGNVKKIVAGHNYTCALKKTGDVWCWGYNGYGQLGDNTVTARHEPVQVTGLSNVTTITAGWYHTCAVTKDGAASCWGYNGHGELGDNSKTARHEPVAVTNLFEEVIMIDAGLYHTCALREGGDVWCWGRNNYGQLGDDKTTDSLTPVTVSGLTSGVKAIAAGDNHTCALKETGDVWCWGYNNSGQLGNGQIDCNAKAANRYSAIPKAASYWGYDITAISAGKNHSCATNKDGVWCWGINNYGQLGNGDDKKITRTAPRPVVQFEGSSGSSQSGAGEAGSSQSGSDQTGTETLAACQKDQDDLQSQLTACQKDKTDELSKTDELQSQVTACQNASSGDLQSQLDDLKKQNQQLQDQLSACQNQLGDCQQAKEDTEAQYQECLNSSGGTNDCHFPDNLDATLQFDGTDDYVNVPFSANLNPEKFTISTWAKVAGGKGDYRTVVASRDANLGYILYAAGNNLWEFWTGNGTQWTPIRGPKVTSATWTHLAGVYDGSKMTFYVNGVEQGSKVVSLGKNVGLPLTFGKASDLNSYYFNGSIGEVRLWNVARTAAQIKADMSSTLTGSETGLVGYWKLEEGSGTTANDSTANKQAGELKGPTWSAQESCQK